MRVSHVSDQKCNGAAHTDLRDSQYFSVDHAPQNQIYTACFKGNVTAPYQVSRILSAFSSRQPHCAALRSACTELHGLREHSTPSSSSTNYPCGAWVAKVQRTGIYRSFASRRTNEPTVWAQLGLPVGARSPRMLRQGQAQSQVDIVPGRLSAPLQNEADLDLHSLDRQPQFPTHSPTEGA